MIKQEVQANEQKKKKTNNNNKREQKIRGEGNQPVVVTLGLLALNYQSPSSTNCVKWKKRQIFNNY